MFGRATPNGTWPRWACWRERSDDRRPSPAGNCARFAARPLPGGGAHPDRWINAGRRAFPDLTGPLRRNRRRRTHPDDETLGIGATAMLAEGGRVSSSGGVGERRWRRTPIWRRSSATERNRPDETRPGPRHPRPARSDSPWPAGWRVGRARSRLTGLLNAILEDRPSGTWCAVTWRGDGHPDHEAVGRAGRPHPRARAGAVLVEYPVWMWHWAVPDDAAVPWHRAPRVPLTGTAVSRKAACGSVLPQPVRHPDPARRSGTAAVCVAPAARRGRGGLPLTARVPDGYFERMYATSADPWQLQARWYERRKYAITLALLPYPRYRHAFEPGCSISVLTEMLSWAM